MSSLSVSQVLGQVDSLLPNNISREQKLHWIHQAECFVLCGENGAQLPQRPMDDDTSLTVGAPFDELYRHYVEAQIHYVCGETERCNNAMQRWNELLHGWRSYRLRSNGGKHYSLRCYFRNNTEEMPGRQRILLQGHY